MDLVLWHTLPYPIRVRLEKRGLSQGNGAILPSLTKSRSIEDSFLASSILYPGRAPETVRDYGTF